MAEKIARWDLRETHKFLKAHPWVSLGMALVMLVAGFASIEGWLRWSEPFARWSFAVWAWAVTLYCLGMSVKTSLDKNRNK